MRTSGPRPTSIDVTPVDKQQFNLLEDALRHEKLPFGDLRRCGGRFFSFSNAGERIGYGGLESSGENQLLRSLVVLPGRRGAGWGRLILRRLEEEAAASGAHSLHLLTLSADSFFARNGYRFADRSAAPTEIASTAEFRDLCPASAAYMVKSII